MQAKIKRWPQGHLFLQCRGNGSPRARSALAMTGYFMSCGAIPGGEVWLPRPTAGKEYGRAGRCRHRPLRNDDKKWCAYHGRRKVYPCCVRAARARVSGQRMAPQRPCESKVQILHIPVREVRGDRRGRHLSREKDSKTLVLAAFFPPFLSL